MIRLRLSFWHFATSARMRRSRAPLSAASLRRSVRSSGLSRARGISQPSICGDGCPANRRQDLSDDRIFLLGRQLLPEFMEDPTLRVRVPEPPRSDPVCSATACAAPLPPMKPNLCRSGTAKPALPIADMCSTPCLFTVALPPNRPASAFVSFACP